MKHKFKQVLSLALVFCMVMSLTCINVYATSGAETETTAADTVAEASEEVSTESTDTEEATEETVAEESVEKVSDVEATSEDDISVVSEETTADDSTDSEETEENTTASITLHLGESYVATGSVTGSYDSDVISVSEDIALKDHTSNTASSLDSFSDEISSSAVLSQAEFILTGSEGVYTVYNEYAGVYLTNASIASTFFSTSASNDMLFTAVENEDGTVSYRICKASTNNRYVIFYAPQMNFNSNSSYATSSESGGYYELVLLHKNSTTSDDDIIPGYTRASSITSGDSYLIAYIWTDGSVIVLYPTNGVNNQTKLVDADTSVVTITGTAVGTTTVTVGSVTYTVTVKSYLKAGSDQGETGTTNDEPFASGTGGSTYYRIPSLITLSDGSLVAAVDARYSQSGDGGGLDTIVSISHDDGETWEYQYVIYFPDSNGYAGTSATTVIDPVMIQGNDGTIYVMADVNPTGVTTMSGYNYPGEGTGYITVDGVERLALTSDYDNTDTTPTDEDVETYEYYVGDFVDGYAYVYNRSDNTKSDYMVDECYNLYKLEDGVYVELTQTQVNSSTAIQQNAFYAASELHVYNTGYMWLASSTDGGETWHHTILNPQIKQDDETALLVSPGRGTVLSDGTIIFTFYTWDYSSSGTVQQSTFIYSKDNGQTWTRVDDIPITNGWSSENELVELADGTLRMFVRNGKGYICYADAVWDEDAETYVWTSESGITSTGVTATSTCNVSAIMYSEKIDGKDAILVACPGNGSSRSAGKIYVFLVDDDNSMELAYTYSVTSSSYAYSCLTELDDGRVALLWESSSSASTIEFDIYDISTIASGATISTTSEVSATVEGIGSVTASATTTDGTKLGGITISKTSEDATTSSGTTTVSVVYDISLTDTDGNAYTGEATITLPKDSAFDGCTGFSGSVAASDSGDAATFEVTEDEVGNLTFTVPHFSEITVTATSDSEDTEVTSTVDVTLYVGQSVSYAISSGSTSSETIDESIATEALIVYSGDAGLGADAGYSDSYTSLENALYTFTGSASTGWTITNSTTDGTAVYMRIGAGSTTNAYPNTTNSTATNTTLYLAYSSDAFYFRNSDSANSRYLAFTNSYLFDAGNSTSGIPSSAIYQFLIYRQVDDGETSSDEIPGYVQVTSLDDITSGSSYLIVAYRGSDYYVLYPSTSSSDAYSHVAKVVKSTVTFTGVSAGTTTEIVGNTQYNITVLDAPTATSGITVDVDTTPFVSGGTNSNANGSSSGKSMTRLTISQGLSFDIDIDSSCDYSSVYWYIVDTSIATVDQNGTVTAVSTGETTLIVIIDGVSYEIPVIVVDYTDNTGSYHGSDGYIIYDLYITEITNTTVYYSVNLSTDLVQCYEGEVLYISVDLTYDSAIDFFAMSDDGYALTNIGSTNSATDYMSLIRDENGNTVTDPTQTEFYTRNGAAGYNQAHTSNWKNKTLVAMIQAAMNAGCEAGLGFTRYKSGTSDCNSSLSFISEKLPDVEKSVYQIIKSGESTAVDYDETVTIESGDTIIFKIVVTRYATRYGINYSAGTLTDTMNDSRNAYFVTLNSNGTYTTSTDTTKDITNDLSEANVTVTDQSSGETVDASQDEGVYTYYVTYSVTDDDVDKNIVNYVALDYTYSSYYSSGSGTASASASAAVTVTNFVPDDIVVDFGLPVTIDYSGTNSHGKYDLSSGTATYGTVTISNNVITYTPNTVLLGVDTVTLTNEQGGEYTFKVYPATTVYYEEGFATYGTGWSVTSGGGWDATTNKGSSTQETEIANTANNSYNNYNYDGAYKTDTTGSESTAASTTTAADSLTFTFTGTGVDIFANCDENSGVVGIKVVDSSGNVQKTLTVDMADTGAYASGGTAYNTPISSISGLTHGTYTVTIYLGMVKSSGFKFDGFRVYGTIDESNDSATSAVYAADLEDNPSYYELRNYVLGTLVTDITSSTYADDIANGVAQVYATNEVDKSNSAIVVYSSGSCIVETADENILDNGPKNELYLDSGASVVFKINTTREVQIGLRSVTGASVTYTINDGSTTNTYTTSSSVDMFYTLQAKGTGEKTYTISVTSGGILSITDIKVSDSSDESIFGSLTADEVVAALTGENETTADATLTVNLVDYTGSVIASTELTDTGAEGESATFAASDILATVNEALSDGYALVDEDSISDQTVTYGESGSVNVQIGKVATLTVTYQKYSGLFKKTTVGIVTLTKVQTSSTSKATFSASEIKAAVPSGYKVLLATSASVSYGSTGTKTVTVY